METLSEAYEWDRTTEQRGAAHCRPRKVPDKDDRPLGSDPNRERLQMSGANIMASWGITIIVLLVLLLVSTLAPTDTSEGPAVTRFDPTAQIGQSDTNTSLARP